MFHNIEFRKLNLVNNILYAYVLISSSSDNVNDGNTSSSHLKNDLCKEHSFNRVDNIQFYNIQVKM